MTIDAGTLVVLLAAVATFVAWLVTQTKAQNREQRRELRYRRDMGIFDAQWSGILQEEMVHRDPGKALPAKPKGMQALEDKEW